MTPPPVASAEAALPAPCSIHDDRLRELETVQAGHEVALRAGSEMFESIQQSIRMLSSHVTGSMERVERTVNRVADDVRDLTQQVSDIRLKQVEQEGQLAGLVKQHDEEEEVVREHRRTLRDIGVRAGLAAGSLFFAALCGAYGKRWLEAFFRALAGG